MAKTRDVITRFKFDLDRAKVAQLNNSLDEILADVRGLSAEEVRLARSLKVATTELTNNQRGFQQASRNAEQYKRAVRDGAGELDRLTLAQQRFDATSRQVSLAGDFQSNLGAVRGLAGVAGASGLGEGVGAVGELIALTEELPRLKAAAAGLPATLASAASAIGPAGLAIGAVVGVLAVAFGDAVTRLQNDAELLREIINTTLDVRVGIATGDITSDQARETFEKNQQRIAVLQDELNNLRREEAQTFEDNVEKYKNAAFGLEFVGDAAARANTFLETGGQANSNYGESVDRLTTDINTLQAENFELGKSLLGTGTAFNEVAEAAAAAEAAAKATAEAEAAEKKLSDARRAFARLQDELILAEDRARRQSLDLTRTQVQERIAQAREEIASNNELIKSRRLSQEANNQLIRQNEVLLANIKGLTAGRGQVDFKQLFGGLDKLAEDARKRADAFKAAQDKISAQTTQFNQALNAIATGLRENVAKLSRQRAAALSEAEREAGTARNEAVRDSGIRIAQLERQTARERERIIRSANAGIANAIQDRDAVALLGAISARDEQLKQQKENYGDQRRQIDQQLAETNRQIVMRLAEQRRTINQRYSEQVADAQRAAQQQRQVEMQKNAQILADLRQAAQQALQIERQKNQSLTQSAIAAAQQISGVFSSIAQRVAMAAASRPTTSSQFGRPGGQIGPAPRPTSPPSLASGFTTAGLMQSRGVSVNIAQAGVTPKMVGKTVEKAYDNFLRGFTS